MRPDETVIVESPVEAVAEPAAEPIAVATGDGGEALRLEMFRFRGRVDGILGPELFDVAEAAAGPEGRVFNVPITERELRVIRHALFVLATDGG
jgi:hypothetical protein